MKIPQTLIFQDDTVELIHNDLISHRKYLLRLTGWNNYYDLRASKDDLKAFADFITSFIESEQNED